MKKMKKIILFVILMLIIVFLLIIGKRYIIVKNILDVENENINALNYTLESTGVKDEITHVIKKMDGIGFIFEVKNENGELEYKSIHNEKESKSYIIDFKNKKIEIENNNINSDNMFYASYFHEFVNKSFFDELKYAITWKISQVELEGEKVYFIDDILDYELWFDKDNYQIVKSNSKLDDLNEMKVHFEKDSVTEKDFELPENIEEFEKVIK